MSAHAVIHGGAWSNDACLTGLAEHIGNTPGITDVDYYSFRESMTGCPDRARRSQRDAIVITLSAGMLAVRGESEPRLVYADGAPLPRTVPFLVQRANQIMLRHLVGSLRPKSGRGDRDFILAGMIEMSSYDGLAGNLKSLPEISRFSSIATAVRLQRQFDVPTVLTYGEQDEFFAISAEERLHAAGSDVTILMRAGRHNDPITNPQTAVNTRLIEEYAAANE